MEHEAELGPETWSRWRQIWFDGADFSPSRLGSDVVPTSLVEVLVFVVGACRFSTQFYLMREDQLILLAESNDLQPPGWKAQQFYLVKEGQLTLVTGANRAS